jgi:hypothetical protein
MVMEEEVHQDSTPVSSQEPSSGDTKNKRDSGYHEFQEVEFFENPEEYFEDEPSVIDKLLSDDTKMQFNTTARVIRPLIRTNNIFIQEDSSPEKPTKSKNSPSKTSKTRKPSRESPPKCSSLDSGCKL